MLYIIHLFLLTGMEAQRETPFTEMETLARRVFPHSRGLQCFH